MASKYVQRFLRSGEMIRDWLKREHVNKHCNYIEIACKLQVVMEQSSTRNCTLVPFTQTCLVLMGMKEKRVRVEWVEWFMFLFFFLMSTV